MLKRLMLLVLVSWFVLPAVEDIVFVSDWGTKERICVMNDHGGNVRILTDAPRSDATIFHLPVYASDTSQIAFMMSQGKVNRQGLKEWDIILMNADDSGNAISPAIFLMRWIRRFHLTGNLLCLRLLFWGNPTR